MNRPLPAPMRPLQTPHPQTPQTLRLIRRVLRTLDLCQAVRLLRTRKNQLIRQQTVPLPLQALQVRLARARRRILTLFQDTPLPTSGLIPVQMILAPAPTLAQATVTVP